LLWVHCAETWSFLPGYPRAAATALLRTVRLGALAVPTRVRWGKPEPYVLRAIERIGPAARPSVPRLPAG
jgi:hypothetical protein